MSIKSVDMFKKVVIENGYEYDSMDDDGWLSYGFNIVKDSTGSKSSHGVLITPKMIGFHLVFQEPTQLINSLINKLIILKILMI